MDRGHYSSRQFSARACFVDKLVLRNVLLIASVVVSLFCSVQFFEVIQAVFYKMSSFPCAVCIISLCIA